LSIQRVLNVRNKLIFAPAAVDIYHFGDFLADGCVLRVQLVA
jgi:hypothetical protein